MKGFSAVIVSTADLSSARALWEGQFGFKALEAQEERDRQRLARRWNIEAHEIAQTLRLACDDSGLGQLLLVEFEQPADPVRLGAQNFDQCPKNLDLYARNLPTRVEELRAAGHQFRTESHSEVTAPNGTRFREIHMHGHDEINIVLVEILGQPAQETSSGNYSGIGAVVTIVEDPRREADFYAEHQGLERVAEHQLSGPEVERMIGLPAGSTLDIIIMGGAQNHLGQVEIIAYGGARGVSLYERTQPPATGILELEFLSRNGVLEKSRAPGGMRLGSAN